MLSVAEVLAFFWGSLWPIVSHMHWGAFTEQAELILCGLWSACLRQFLFVVCKHDVAIVADVRWEMWKGFWGLFVLMVFFYALSLMGLPHGKKTLIWQRRETHVMAQNSYWISKLHDSEENRPSCCHSNWEFAPIFASWEWSGMHLCCCGQEQETSIQPRFSSYWNKLAKLPLTALGSGKSCEWAGRSNLMFLTAQILPSLCFPLFQSYLVLPSAMYDHINVSRVPKSNRAHCLAWDLITKAFCDSRQLILLVKS